MLAGCDEPNTYVEPPPPEVTVATPLLQEVTDYLEFTGTTSASGRVDVRARVAGILQRMDFVPGTEVNAGEVLFEIDPREYQAQLQAAEGELASAHAELERAGIELERALRLFEQQAASDADVVKWRGQQKLAEAAAQRAEAAVARAQLDVDYSKVTAPISGRVGRNLVDVGALVGESEATVLTNITHADPMFVYFDLNERDLLRVMKLYRERVKEKGLNPDEDSDVEAEILVELGLADEEGFPHTGVLDFAESGVDAGTGTIRLRGSFVNAEKPPALIPGLFARVRMPIATRADMPMVSEEAVGADQSGRYALVVTEDDVVEKRNLQVGALNDGLYVVEAGIQATDRVVVNGLLRARPGGKVAPTEVEMSSLGISARTAAEADKEEQ
jgi:RND family efflux transporter MFP subunit